MSRIHELDGLRGWAILLVLLAHFPLVHGLEPLQHLAIAVGSGHFGVNVFFVLSGFLITRILIREKAEGRFSMWRFYLKRALRIFPIYYITLLVVVLLITARHAGALAIYLGNFVFAFDTAPHPLRHTWSLAVEEHFYLVWPLIVGLIPLRTSRMIVRVVLPLLALAGAVITASLLPSERAEHLIYRGTLYQMLPLCLGSAVAFSETRARQLPRSWSIAFLLMAPVLILLAVRAKSVHLGGPLVLSRYTERLVLYSLASLCTLLVVLNATRERLGRLRVLSVALFSNPVIRSIGSVSYGIYLYHYVILFALGLQYPGASLPLLNGAALLGLILAVAYFSWYVIEAPLLRLKERLARPSAADLE